MITSCPIVVLSQGVCDWQADRLLSRIFRAYVCVCVCAFVRTITYVHIVQARNCMIAAIPPRALPYSLPTLICSLPVRWFPLLCRAGSQVLRFTGISGLSSTPVWDIVVYIQIRIGYILHSGFPEWIFHRFSNDLQYFRGAIFYFNHALLT